MGETSLQMVRDLILACTGHLCKDGANITMYPAHRAQFGILCTLCMEIGKPWKGGNLTMRRNNGKVEHRYDFSDPQAGKDV